jgi:hypothetical protein
MYVPDPDANTQSSITKVRLGVLKHDFGIFFAWTRVTIDEPLGVLMKSKCSKQTT